jgi:hypothetical protein
MRRFLLSSALLLAGCSFADTTLWPTLTGEDPRGRLPAAPTPTATLLAGPSLQRPRPRDLSVELRRLQADQRQHDSALEIIRGDTELPAREAVSRLVALSTLATSDSALAQYLVQAARAEAAQPGAEGTQRQRFLDLERQAADAGAASDARIAEIGAEIASRSRALAAAPAPAPARGAASRRSPATPAAAPATAVPSAARRPLVTVRFDQPDVAYEQDVRFAVSRALQRRPDAVFDIVALSPPGSPPGEATRRNVAGMLKAAVAAGARADRLTLSFRTEPGVAGDEVRLFVR